jgi:selenocysteine lyase/cysteine desulfurase
LANYEIMETPGKKIIDLSEHNIDPPHNQDEAQMAVARLRALAKSEGRKVDFVFKRIHEAANSNGSSTGATSVRLTEEVRSKLARIVGKIMYETGTTPSMGDAVNLLVAHYLNTIDLDTDDKIIAKARELIQERKERKAAANAS